MFNAFVHYFATLSEKKKRTFRRARGQPKMLTPLQNLKAFVINRPPLVVFTACLATFAIATLSLSYYLSKGPVRNPDIEVDWNGIMEHMSQWKLCIVTSSHRHLKPLTMGEGARSQNRQSFKDVPSKDSMNSQSANSSISVSLRLRLGFRAEALPKEMDIFWGTISLEDLGFDDLDSEHKAPPIKAVIDLGEKHQLVNCTKSGYCDVVPTPCVTFYGSVSVLPNVRGPKTCPSRKPKDDDATFKILHLAEDLEDDDEEELSCSGITILQEYIHDPLFEETLNYKEQTLMNIHLTYTSYFLFVMVMTVLCYAIVRGQSKPKTPLLDKAASV